MKIVRSCCDLLYVSWKGLSHAVLTRHPRESTVPKGAWFVTLTERPNFWIVIDPNGHVVVGDYSLFEKPV